MNFDKEEILIFIKQNIKAIVLALVCSVAIGICAWNYFFNSDDEYDEVSFETRQTQTVQEVKDEPKESEKKIFVDVKGAVKMPGVYEATKDKRVKDLIEEAGGLVEGADTSTINLSEKVKDQMVIYVLKEGEKPKAISSSSSTSSSNNDIVNINTANEEQLMKISGVGKTKAQAIIEYREKNGEFKKKEDITKVKGIGKGTFEKIKDKIEV